MNLIERYDRLTPEQQTLFGRLICAYVMNTTMLVDSMPFMKSQASVVEDMCVACLDGASLYVPLSREEVA